MRMVYGKLELVMRIISQNGEIDLPYEKVCLYIDSTLIIARCDNVKYIMGSYQNNEQAVKHMEMCRKHYAAAEYNRRIIPKGDTLVDMEKAKEFLTSGFTFQFPN